MESMLAPVWFRTALACAVLGGTSGCLDRELKALNPCLISAVSRTVSVTNIDKVDILFSVDNSGSMAEEQSALKQQFPRMIDILTSGMRSPDDPSPFPAAKDLHLAVVSSDMGAVGQRNVQGCDIDGGDDGRLQHAPRGDIGCQASYPAFLSYIAGRETPEQIATNFGCIAELGTDGCGYEQQLESPFKALWPSVYRDESGREVDPNPYTFLATSPDRTKGRGDQAAPAGSLGFLRNDPATGLSLLAVIVVSDEEDCSSHDTSHLRVPTGPTDPLAAQGNQVRCFLNKQNLYDVSRYIDGFKKLRPGYEQLVVFAGIVGVPPAAVDAQARSGVDFTDAPSRDAYYARLLNDPDMQEQIVAGSNPQTAEMRPSCTRTDVTGKPATAFPPRRIVQVAQGFGVNGVVQSICQDDFGPAMDAIIEVIARQLSAVCLPRALVRRSNGLVSCSVVWELPPADKAPRGTPTECADRSYLHAVDAGRAAINERGGANCKLEQLPITDSGAAPSGSGWYYDDFSVEVRRDCSGSKKQRVAFTDSAKPGNGVVVKLECLDATQRVELTDADLAPGYQPALGSSCLDVDLDGGTLSGDDACIITRTSGEDHSLFCHPDLNVCVKSCQSSTECPGGWECDLSPEKTGGRPFCANPTCSAL